MKSIHILNKILMILTFSLTYEHKGTILIDWSNSQTDCKSNILSHFRINNSLGNTDNSLALSHVCKSNGVIMKIDDCIYENTNSVELLSYFFTLPENDASKQCACQAKCKDIHESSYTMKFLKNGAAKYFTTSNPCVAFCNKGYEIFLSSYAVNSFPDFTGYDIIKKSFDSGCYNRLDDNNKRGRQMALMKIELCKARIICNLLVNQYIKDIEEIEKKIYGNTLNDNTILTSAQKYWIKPFDSKSYCIELIDSGTNSYCINKYGLLDRYYCNKETNLVVTMDGNSTSLRYVDAVHQLYKCATRSEDELDVEADNTQDCVCKLAQEIYIFSTDVLETAYGTSNQRYSLYREVNFFFENDSISLNYLKEEYKEGSCECKDENLTEEYIYDIFCPNIMYSACIINNNTAVSKKFSDGEFITECFEEIYKNPVDLVLGYGKTKCENLNEICENPKVYQRSCFLKYKNFFEYPLIGVDNDFMRCVEDIYHSETLDSTTFYFDCPPNTECNEYTCTLKYMSICEDPNFVDTEGICKFNDKFECYKDCENDFTKICFGENNSDVNLLGNKYNSCLRKCFGPIDYKCYFDNITECENEECKNLFCKNENNLNTIYCQTQECAPTDQNCICDNTTCKNADNINDSYCFYPGNSIDLPYKVSEKEKCLNTCKSITQDEDYKFCTDCLDTPESCCTAYCVDFDNINITECVNINQNTKLISQNQKCIYDCTNTTYELLAIDECNDNQCLTDCNKYDSSTTEYCSFDQNSVKKCINEKELCLLNCQSNIQISVNCEGLNDYECLLSYCSECYSQKLKDDNIVCQDMCKCTNYNLKSIDECSCFTEKCESKSSSLDKYCIQNGLLFQLLSNIDTCIKECRKDDYSLLFQCNDCVTVDDCCIHKYDQANVNKCVEYNNTYFYSNQVEICQKGLKNIIYNEVEESNCCLAECNLNDDNLCVEENDNFVLYNKSDYCYKKCVEKNNQIAIVNYNECCLTNCLSQSKSKFCIKNNDQFESIAKNEYCNTKCYLNNNIVLYDDSFCCENECYSEQNKYALGSYCNDSYEIYDSWLDYCITKRCNNIQETVYFCSNLEICTTEICKKQIAESKCKDLSNNSAISINQSGQCNYYNNICYATMLKNPNEKIFECGNTNLEDCLASSDFYLTYSKSIKANENQKYCYKEKVISATELNYYKKCVNKPTSDIFDCPNTNCNQSYCKKKYCNNKCEATERLYWGYDCNYYNSVCELDCLGIDYFDFFDVSKLLSVCKLSNELKSGYLDLIGLKKTVCLRTGKLKTFNTFVSWIYKTYTDCLRLEAKNLSECEVKCRDWARNL